MDLVELVGQLQLRQLGPVIAHVRQMLEKMGVVDTYEYLSVGL
jgi:hypothetical protein